MNYLFGLLILLVVLYLTKQYRYSKKRKQLQQQLQKNWGKPKTDTLFYFHAISRYFEKNHHKKNAFHIIPNETKVDLDLHEIFKFIDRTCSKIGQQFLYFKLRTIGNMEQLINFSSLVDIFSNNKDLALKSQFALSTLNDNNLYDLEELINGQQIDQPKHLWLIYLLSLSVVAFIIAGFFHPGFFLLIIPVYAVHIVLHYGNKSNTEYYSNGVSQLSITLKVAKLLAKEREILNHYKNVDFIKNIETIKFKTEFFGLEKNLNNEYAFAVWVLIEAFKILFNLEYIIFYSFINAIIKEQYSIEKLYVFVGEIDTAIATASLKSGSLETCTPTFSKSNHISTTAIIHPLVNNCIANNLKLNHESLLLTGSNMSGKSTFIRTLSINSLLAQTLNICFAKEYTAPFFKLHSAIRITDNLLEDTSYYLQEVLRVKKLIESSKDDAPCLFVLDEIFKGTNTVERISGGKAILSYLNQGNNTVLVSTHDIELAEMLKQEHYALYHFTETIENNELFFDHQLKPGKLKTRNAIQILALYDYPKEIISDARQVEKGSFVI